ncbi:MAG TPA: acyl carrier protein [Allosphingosinicella sp.]|nr:acyl carrier protein [Allosphingosinicella sp.]
MEHASTLTLLVREVAKIAELDSVDPDVGLNELGVDSLRLVELVLVCDQLYGINLDPERLEITEFTTLRDLDKQMSEMEPA